MSEPVFPLDPPGVRAKGNGSVWFVPAIADLDAPTVAEINAGINLSCALYDFNISFEQTSTERLRYCYKESVQSPGRISRTIDRLRYDYDPQNPDSEEYAYYAELTPGRRGFIVDRRGLDARTEEVAAGQYVHITPAELGARDDRPIDPSAEGETLSVEQLVFVVGEKRRDVAIVA